MKIRLKAVRVQNNSVTFKIPTGGQVYLQKIGDVSQELDPTFAYSLINKYPDMIEAAEGAARMPADVVVEKKMETGYDNKAAQVKIGGAAAKQKKVKAEETPLSPTLI